MPKHRKNHILLSWAARVLSNAGNSALKVRVKRSLETVFTFTSLKPEKETKLDIDKPVDGTKFSETSATSGNKKESASTPDTPYVDVSTLHPATIDIATYKDALCHKMSM